MSEPRPADQERLWRVLRAADPPHAAAERVRERVEAALHRRPRRRAAIAVSVAAAAVAALLFSVRERDHREKAPRVVSVESARQNGRDVVAGQPLAKGAVQVAPAGHLRIALEGAELDVAGPAAVELRPRALYVSEGRVEVRGSTRVSGPGCEAEVSGRAAVEVQSSRVQVTVFAGSASVTESQDSCSVIDLSRSGVDKGTGVDKGSRVNKGSSVEKGSAVEKDSAVEESSALDKASGIDSPGRSAAGPSAARAKASSPARLDDALARQVDAYWAADRLRASDPTGALARFEALQALWPGSPLRPEIDLAIIDLLVRLDRTDEARARAREFLRRYPDSPRRDDVRRIEMRQ